MIEAIQTAAITGAIWALAILLGWLCLVGLMFSCMLYDEWHRSKRRRLRG